MVKIEESVPLCPKASRRKFLYKPAQCDDTQIIQRVKTGAVHLGSLPEFEEQLDKFMEDTLMDKMTKGQRRSLTCKLYVHCTSTFLSLNIQNLNDLLP